MIDLKDISRIYQIGSEKVYALNKANLHIDPGEFVSIIGLSRNTASTPLAFQAFSNARPSSILITKTSSLLLEDGLGRISVRSDFPIFDCSDVSLPF